MSKIEKQMLVAMAVLLVVLAMSIFSVRKSVQNAGGLSQITIDVGKEIKHISNEINKE